MTGLSLLASETLAYSTTRIECTLSDGRLSTGTGYFFQFYHTELPTYPVLVTNKHVIAGGVRGRFIISEADEHDQRTARMIEVKLDPFVSPWILHPDAAVDLAILPLAPVHRTLEAQGKRPFFRYLNKSWLPTTEDIVSFGAVEDVLMVGYPNGLWDAVNNQPISRRGITATHPARDYEGRKEFLIDAACFPGSSGSPVFLYHSGLRQQRDGNYSLELRHRLLGTLYAGPTFTAKGDIRLMAVPTEPRPVAISQLPMNLGCVIKIDRLLEFEEAIDKRDPRP